MKPARVIAAVVPAVAALGAVTGVASGQGDFGPERTLVVDRSANPVSLHPAVNRQGDAVFVWTAGSRRGAGEDIVRARVRTRGGRLLPVQTIRRSTGRLTGLPWVAYGGNGTAVAVWEEIERSNGSTARVMAAVKPRGKLFARPVRLGSTSRDFDFNGTGIGAEQGSPKVAMNARGHALIAWLASRSSIRTVVMGKSGRFRAPELVRIAPGVPVRNELAAGIDRNGNATVAFVSGILPPPADERHPPGVWVADRTSAGRFGAPRHVSGGARFAGQISLAVGADATLALAWLAAPDPEELPAGPVQASVRRPGSDFGPPVTVSSACAGADSGSDPRAAVTTSTDVVAVWKQRACDPARLDYATSEPASPFAPQATLASPVARDAYVSQLAADGEGRTVAVWAIGSPAPGQPVASAREPGQPFGPPAVLGAAPPGGVVVTPKAAAGGRVTVVSWQTGRGFRYAVRRP